MDQTSGSNPVVITDEFYTNLPTDELIKLRKDKPWDRDYRHFSKCMINITAATKMLKHSIQGVIDGKSKGGMSVEVMGLLIGKPIGNSIIITDAIQLPIQGMENRIEAPAEVQILMAQMVDILPLKRQERILGWYHSHPFELLSYSHCHLSSTDVTTQTSFQSLTPWWTALVIDPIRSITEKRFEIGAYRTYPIGYFQDDGIAPDLVKWTNITNLKRRWGVVPNRYYTLDINYWMSKNAGKISNRTGSYTNWTNPLLENVFRDILRYSKNLSIINDGLVMIGVQSERGSGNNNNINGDQNKYPIPDGQMNMVNTQAMIGQHIDQCCGCGGGQLGHSKLLQLISGIILKQEEAAVGVAVVAIEEGLTGGGDKKKNGDNNKNEKCHND